MDFVFVILYFDCGFANNKSMNLCDSDSDSDSSGDDAGDVVGVGG